MNTRFFWRQHCFVRRAVCSFLAVSLAFSLVLPPSFAQLLPNLPAPGQSVKLTAAFEPPVLKGMIVHPENPLLFDFIVDRGQDKLDNQPLKTESEKLIKYFLASMTVPDKDAWVNLSPYEKDRIIPDVLSQTEMGRQMLEQDYILKQLASSLTDPNTELGQKYWTEVRRRAQIQFGTTDLPYDSVSKVWIVPDGATVVEKDGFAYITESKLNVMLEQDYFAMSNQKDVVNTQVSDVSKITTEVFRELILPELIKEVNTGRTFAQTRQVYQSVVLATWYKQALKDSLLVRIYADKAKVKGVETDDKAIKQKVYQQYLEAFKKGVYNLIKEDQEANGEIIPRKYFSGGEVFKNVEVTRQAGEPAAEVAKEGDRLALAPTNMAESSDEAAAVQGAADAQQPFVPKLSPEERARLVAAGANGRTREKGDETGQPPAAAGRVSLAVGETAFSLERLAGPQEWIPKSLMTKIENALNGGRSLVYLDFEVNDRNGRDQLIERLENISGDQYVALLIKGEGLAGAKAFHVVIDRKDVLLQPHNLTTILDVREETGMVMTKFFFVETYRVFPEKKIVQNMLIDFNSYYDSGTESVIPNKNPEFAGFGYFILQVMARNFKKYFPGYYLLDHPNPEAPSVHAWLKNNFEHPGFEFDSPQGQAIFENSVGAYDRAQGVISTSSGRAYVVRRIPSPAAAAQVSATEGTTLAVKDILPDGISPESQVRVAGIVTDFDLTAAVDSYTPLQGQNLKVLVDALVAGQFVHIISGSPYAYETEGSLGTVNTREGSLRRRAVEPIENELKKLGQESKIKNLVIHYISGRGSVTFDEAGAETILEPQEARMDEPTELEIARGFALAVVQLYFSKTDETALKVTQLNTATNIKEVQAILQSVFSGLGLKYMPSIGAWGSELVIDLAFEQFHGQDVLKLARTIWQERGLKLPSDKYYMFSGLEFAKVALGTKVDVIKAALEELKPEGLVIALGDANNDDFLTKLNARGLGFPYLPVYLGKADDVKGLAVHLVRGLNGQDNVKSTGFAPLLREVFMAEAGRKSYNDLIQSLVANEESPVGGDSSQKLSSQIMDPTKRIFMIGGVLSLLGLRPQPAHARLVVDPAITDPNLKRVMEIGASFVTEFLTTAVKSNDPDVNLMAKKANEILKGVMNEVQMTVVEDLNTYIRNNQPGQYMEDLMNKGSARAMVIRINQLKYIIVFDLRTLREGFAAMTAGVAHEIVGHLTVDEKGLSSFEIEEKAFIREIKYLKALTANSKLKARMVQLGMAHILKEIEAQIQREEVILKFIQDQIKKERKDKADKKGKGNTLRDAGVFDVDVPVKVSPATIAAWERKGENENVQTTQIITENDEVIEVQYKIVFSPVNGIGAMPAGISAFHIREEGRPTVVVFPESYKDLSPEQRRLRLIHELFEAYITGILEDELIGKTGRLEEEFTQEEKDKIARDAHILASAKVRNDEFYLQQIAGMTRERVEVFRRETIESRSYHLDLIQQYIPTIVQEYLDSQQKFQNALNARLAELGEESVSPGGAKNIGYQIEQSAQSIEREVKQRGVEKEFIAFVNDLAANPQTFTVEQFSQLLGLAEGVGQELRAKFAELAVLYAGTALTDADRMAGVQTDFKFIMGKVAEKLQAASTNASSKEVGGIDFDPSKLDLQIKRNGRGVPLPISEQNLDAINIEGLYPVIINILPINKQTLPILSQLDAQSEPTLVKI